MAFDIKPESCPNPINTKKKGVTPVAILGTDDLDVTTIDLSSLSLLGLAPIRTSIEDVATPFEPFIGKLSSTDCTEDGADGFDDLTLKFDTQDLIDALEAILGSPVEDDETFALVITGNLQDGTPIEGEDVIVIKKKGK